MPDLPRRRGRRATLALAAALLAGGVAAAWAPVALAVPGEGHECGGGTLASAEANEDCGEGTGGTGGINLGSLLPIAGAVVVVGVVALGGTWFLLLRRRAAAPLIPEPADAAAWWKCQECGRTNVVGSARCYGCGAWHR